MHKTIGLAQSYGIFKDFPNERITNFNNIKNKIIELTNEKCGTKKFISSEPIILSLYSEDIPDLTLVDLPGITKTAQDDQPKNIEELTVNLCKTYCEDKNTLIISVNTANQDLSTCDGIKYAKLFDPSGERTLGVLTKIDIMNEGSDATKILNNEEIKLKYGYIGVKGRTLKEINEKVPVKIALENEKKFFAQHPIYSKIDETLLGTENLVLKLTKILHSLINKNLPDIIYKINEEKKKAETFLKNLGPEIPEEENKKFEYIFNLIQTFYNLLNSELHGKIDLFSYNKINYQNKSKNKKDNVSSNLRKKFDGFIEEIVDDNYLISKELTDEEIIESIDKYQGHSLDSFLTIDSFLSLIIPKIKLFKMPIHELIDDVYEILVNISNDTLKLVFKNHYKLNSILNELITNFIYKKKKNTTNICNDMIEAEEGFLFTNKNIFEFLEQTKNSNLKYINELRFKLDSYYKIIGNNIKDYVPKLVGSYLVKAFIDEVNIYIFGELSKQNFLVDLMKEKKEVYEERKSLNKKLNTLKNAEQIIHIEIENHINIDDLLNKENEEFDYPSESDSESNSSKKSENIIENTNNNQNNNQNNDPNNNQNNNQINNPNNNQYNNQNNDPNNNQNNNSNNIKPNNQNNIKPDNQNNKKPNPFNQTFNPQSSTNRGGLFSRTNISNDTNQNRNIFEQNNKPSNNNRTNNGQNIINKNKNNNPNQNKEKNSKPSDTNYDYGNLFGNYNKY